MKPYKVNNTWVDLDHLLAIEDKVVYHDHGVYIAGYATMSFLNEPLRVWLGRSWSDEDEGHKKKMQNAQIIWDDFKTAWMNKDKEVS
jgi:hypothetical protein